VVEERHERRPDIVVFVNGLPLAVIELKNAADEDADIWRAIYKPEIKLFTEVHAAITCPAIWPIVRDVAGRLLNRGLLAGAAKCWATDVLLIDTDDHAPV
jgi:hypothetical protein